MIKLCCSLIYIVRMGYILYAFWVSHRLAPLFRFVLLVLNLRSWIMDFFFGFWECNPSLLGRRRQMDWLRKWQRCEMAEKVHNQLYKIFSWVFGLYVKIVINFRNSLISPLKKGHIWFTSTREVCIFGLLFQEKWPGFFVWRPTLTRRACYCLDGSSRGFTLGSDYSYSPCIGAVTFLHLYQ